ncbi:TetR/AcrR family transcriptional regulator [Pontibacillus salicampi]|uniref:TetR/AcrR family transcriptional regulator n=1 Tax=Pontibacillus salicampi TaxID=1449801 RepID=A0ABV6LME8_9BACI
MTPRKSASEELTNERIMEAARELFVEEGYQLFSMRKLARKLNCSHGAIYHHFENKAALFYTLVEDGFSSLKAVLNQIERNVEKGEETIYEVLMGFIRFGLENKRHYEIMFLFMDKELQTYEGDAPNLSYQHFARVLRNSSRKIIQAKEVWSVFLALHGFVAHYCRREESFLDIEVLADSYVKILMKGINS